MENMVRPENTARLTVSHKPTMFTYRDLGDVKKKKDLSVHELSLAANSSLFALHCRNAHILACPKVLQEM